MNKATPETFGDRLNYQIDLHRDWFVPTDAKRSNPPARVKTSEVTSALNKAFPYHHFSHETVRKWRERIGEASHENRMMLTKYFGTDEHYFFPLVEEDEKRNESFEMNSEGRPDYLVTAEAINNLDPEALRVISYLVKTLPKRKRPA